MTNDEIEQQFSDIIRDQLTDKQFWSWVCSWYDVEGIIEIAESWETDVKKDQLDEWKKQGIIN